MNTPQGFWKVVNYVGIILAIFLAVVAIKQLISIKYVGKSEQIINTISVTGTGEAFAKPDIASFSFTVTENEKTVAGAQEKATIKINKALQSIKEAGIEDKDVQTISYNISPRYEYQQAVCTASYCPPGKQVLNGYDVSQTIQVKIRVLDKAGSILTTIGAIGVQNVQSLNFTVDDMDAVRAQARNEAIAEAKAKAKVLAEQIGVRLVRVNSFYESGDGPWPIAYGMGGAERSAVGLDAVKSVPPQIPSGEQKITSNVTITYEIR